jgi:hypothetical protein
LRNRVDSAGAMLFEARLDTLDVDGQQRIRWSSSDLRPPLLMRAAELFAEGLKVREWQQRCASAKVKQAALGFEPSRMDFCLLLVMPISIVSNIRCSDLVSS